MGLFGPPSEDIDLEQQLLKEHNPYEWLACQVTLPGLEMTIESASPWVRGLATGAFGVIGLAATSGVNQSYEHRLFSKLVRMSLTCVFLGTILSEHFMLRHMKGRIL